jgi:arylsulfatase A-like enzyme
MSESRPNILFIYSDQHRYDCVGANGHPLLQTPNMDRLAEEGANFTHAFTPIPMCVPARCSLLTGQWPTQHGVVFNYDGETFRRLDPDLPTCSAAVRDAGYHNIHVGRWHVDPKRSPLDFGFHDYVPDWRYRKWRSAQGIPPIPSDQGWRGQTDVHITPDQSSLAWSANRAIRWIEQTRESDDPFFLRWQMSEPHLACRPPEPYASMYPPETIAPWPGFGEEQGKPYIQRQMRRTWDVEDFTWDDWAPIVSRYLGVISLLDHEIGRVLAALDRLGLAENTLVIYSADHGDMCGSHGMVDKHYIMYDDVVRVPLLMRWPGVIPQGRTSDAFVSNAIDLATTFCDAAGADVPDTFMGTNLLPLATGQGDAGRQDILASYHGNQFGAFSQRMVRDRRWKYVWNASCEDELYDLDTDPGERVNRAGDAKCASELSRLRGRLAAWMTDTHDVLMNGSVRRQLVDGHKL